MSNIEHDSVMDPPWNQLQLRTHRIDSHFVPRGDTLTTTNSVWNKINGAMIRDRLPIINFKPEYMKAYSEGTITRVDNFVSQKYYKEVASTYFEEFKKMLDIPVNNRYSLVRDEFDTQGFSIKQSEGVPADDVSVRIAYIKDPKGWITDFEVVDPILEMGALFVDDILEHHGIKGMKWGHRKSVHPDIAHISKKTRKDAAKDAEEFTRAKLFYGESAGTRRKLIKAKVESKKHRDKNYAKAFDHFVSQTDLGKRADQARSERKRKNAKNFTKKTTKGVGHVLRGNNQYANTAAVGVVGVGSILLNKHLKQMMDEGEEFLEHHGIKGMKWGVRKATSSRVERVKKARARRISSNVTVSDKGKKLKTTGGKNLPAHPDAIRARTIGQKTKASGVKALSDAELRAYANRLQLEQNVHRLNFTEKSAPRRFVSSFLGKQGSRAANEAAKTGATKVGKGAVNAATRKSIRIARTAAAVSAL